MKEFTDVAQSKFLMENGVEMVADNFWLWVDAHQDYEFNNGDESKAIPAFTFLQLLELLPRYIDNFGFLMLMCNDKADVIEEGPYTVSYSFCWKRRASEAIDAVVLMIKHLLSEGWIFKDGKLVEGS